MPAILCTGAVLRCSFGAAPSVFSALSLPGAPNMLGSLPGATMSQMAPLVNIMTFGMCSSPANPQVAAATTAALGVLTPMPCIPATAAPWAPASTKTMNFGMPVATVASKCLCTWGGVIAVDVPAGGNNSTS